MTDFRSLTNAGSEEEYLKESVDILPEAIREEFVRVPSDLAYWGERYADAVKAYLLAEHFTKKTKAHLGLQIREISVAKGQKLTVGDLDAWVEQSPDYQSAKLHEIECEAAKVAARCRLDAVSAKKDMVMSLGAYIRSEMAPSHLNNNRRD